MIRPLGEGALIYHNHLNTEPDRSTYCYLQLYEDGVVAHDDSRSYISAESFGSDYFFEPYFLLGVELS